MVDPSTSTTGTSYPRKRKITLSLDIEVKNEDKDSYIFASPEVESDSTLQIGFLADLFDLLNFEAQLGVEKINNFTHEQITRTLQTGL